MKMREKQTNKVSEKKETLYAVTSVQLAQTKMNWNRAKWMTQNKIVSYKPPRNGCTANS